MSDLTGGCACGQVRYRASGDPRFALICQCRSCQLMTGTGHAPQFALPLDGFEISGALTDWSRDSDADYPVKRHFCPTCGTPMYGITSRMPDVAMILAGTLDDPDAITPSMMVFQDARIAWDHQHLGETSDEHLKTEPEKREKQ